MTHPLLAAAEEEVSRWRDTSWSDVTVARAILLALLRHPAMREPSEAASQAMDDAWDDGASREAVWAVGCDALAREIEEASR